MLFSCPRFRDQVYMLKRNEWWTDGVSNLQWKHWNYVTYLWKARTWASPCSHHVNCFPWAKNLEEKGSWVIKLTDQSIKSTNKCLRGRQSQTVNHSASLLKVLSSEAIQADSRSMAWDMSLNQLIHLICRRNRRLWLKKRIGKLEWGMHSVM